MIWLRRLLFRLIVKGFEHRMESLEKLMDFCQKERSDLYIQIEKLETETPLPQASIDKLKGEIESLSRMYWDAFNRHEEVESGLIWVTKDFNRR